MISIASMLIDSYICWGLLFFTPSWSLLFRQAVSICALQRFLQFHVQKLRQSVWSFWEWRLKRRSGSPSGWTASVSWLFYWQWQQGKFHSSSFTGKDWIWPCQGKISYGYSEWQPPVVSAKMWVYHSLLEFCYQVSETLAAADASNPQSCP